MGLKLVKEFGANSVFQVDRPDILTVDFIENESWPDKSRALIFQFNDSVETAHEILWRNIHDRYFCRLYYYGDKTGIAVRNPGIPVMPLPRHSFENREAMEKAYVETVAKYFWEPWGEYIFKFFGEAKAKEMIYSQARECLAADRLIAHSKNGRPVSILACLPVFEPVAGETVDWVLWVWMHPSLEPAERAYVRGDFLEFLKRDTGNRMVVAPTEPFNKKANIFWQRLGFKLGCAGITIK